MSASRTHIPALLILLAAAALPAQGQTTDAILTAHLRSVAGTLESESQPDTARIQAALTACPPGGTVRLSRAPDATTTAFLTAPITLPPGVTLALAPGVTLFASRNPDDYACTPTHCTPLITIPPGTLSSAIAGPGILDARGTATLLNTHQTWQDRPIRPTLIDSQSPLTLQSLTVRNPPGQILSSVAQTTIAAAHLLASIPVPALPPTTLSDTTLSNILSPPGTTAVLYAGPADRNHCLLSSTTCTPATLPTYTGTLSAEAGHLTAVLIAPEASTPLPTGFITISEAQTLIATAALDTSTSSFAEVPLPPLSPGLHHLTATYAGDTFATLDLTVPPAQPTLTLAADSSTLSPNARLTLTATLSAAATGTITFLQASTPIATIPIQINQAALSITTASPGPATLTATYSGDPNNLPASSNPLTLAVPGSPIAFTLTASTAAPAVGSPFTLTTTGLPADATGFVTITDNAVPLATLPLTSTTPATYQSFGDSITAGFTVQNSQQHYPELLAAAQGLALTNFAASGSVACNVLPMQILPGNLDSAASTSAPLYSLMIGTNDADFNGTGPYESIFRTCHQATLAWLGIPPAYKLLATAPAFQILGGVWTVDPTHFNTLYNNQGSGTVRLQITTAGAPIYLWPLLDDNTPGTFTLTLDGTPTGTPYSTQPTPAIAGLLAHSGFALIRLPVPAGVHTVEITLTSGSMGILAAATAPSPGRTSLHPIVLSADVPNQRSDGATTPATLAQYTADARADAALLRADGLDLRFVTTRDTMLATPPEMSDNVHPDALGQAELAAAFAVPLAGTPITPLTHTSATQTGTQVATQTAIQTATQTSVQITPGTAGPHLYAATYSGDSTYPMAAAAQPLPLTVVGLPASLTLAASHTTVHAGDAITFTAQLSPAAATGQITFLDAGTPLATVSLTAGQAAVALNDLPLGPHQITAAYPGDTLYAPTQTPAIAVQINPVTATLSLAPVPDAPYGTPITLSAILLPANASGQITFRDSATTLATVAVLNGHATYAVPALTPGLHTLFATYAGDPFDYPATSPTVLTNIGLQTTFTTLAALPATAVYATSQTLTAFVSPATATGQITFRDGNSTLAPVTVLNGTASTQLTPALLPGLHSFTATYSGDANSSASTSSPQPTLITPAPSSTTLAPLAATYTLSAGVTLSATVTPAAATGQITFTDAISGPLGTVRITAGRANLTLPPLPAGPHTFTATYTGDPTTLPSTSSAVSTQIILDTATLTLTPPAPTLYAAPQTLTATLTPSSTPILVTLTDATLGPIATAFTTSGQATFTLPTTLTVGPHTLTATSPGDAHSAPATSQPVTLTILPDPTSTTLTLTQVQAQIQLIATSPILITVAVTSPAGATPTGIVTLLSGSQTLVSAPLTNPQANTAYASFTLDSTPFGLGTHNLTASYQPDPNHLPSTSTTATLTIAPMPTQTTLTTRQTPTTITLTAQVTAVTAPTGTVTFLNGTTPLATLPLDATGKASTTFTPSPTLRYTLTAVYTPTGLFAPSTSSAVDASLTPPVALQLTPSILTLSAGTAATASLNLVPLAGWTGPVTLTCQSPEPYLTCSFPTGNAMEVHGPTVVPVQITVAKNLISSLPDATTLVLALLLPSLSRRRRNRLTTLTLLLTVLTGCAPNSGTFFNIPSGTHTLQILVTAANVTQTTSLTVRIPQ